MNVFATDANLFLVLHAVLEEKSATRAAERLHVTQSAISNALGRLRDLFGDPLVVRSGRGLVSTPRADELAPHLAEAVKALQVALDGGAVFVAKESTRSFVLCAADNHQGSEVPRIAQAFAAAMPRAKLRVVSTDYLAATDGLATGVVDCMLGPEQVAGPGLSQEWLFEERAAFVVRRDHPTMPAKMSVKAFNDARHVDVEVVLGRTGIGHDVATRHFKALGLRREAPVTVPHFTAAAMVASRTDLMAGLPHRFAKLMCGLLPLRVVPTLFPVPKIGIALVWHERTDADPGARFFRRLVADTLKSVESSKA